MPSSTWQVGADRASLRGRQAVTFVHWLTFVRESGHLALNISHTLVRYLISSIY